jgi:hypothetical protein
MIDVKARWGAVTRSAEGPFGLAILICFHIVICCVSLVCVSNFKNSSGYFNPATFHIFYDPARLLEAVAVIAAFSLVSLAFVFARFSFGYIIGFYLYTMVLGYLWLNLFSDLNYDHRLAGLSAAISAVAFLLPTLLITSPIPRTYALSERSLDHLLTLIMLVTTATIVFAGIYNFRFVAMDNIYAFRNWLEFPPIITYLLGITSSALLPFAFACFVVRRAHWRAAAALLLILLFYPITLSKLVLFAPAWLVGMSIVSKIFEPRTSTILSLLVPALVGVFAFILNAWPVYLNSINFRMLAIPSVAMDLYNNYFSNHDLTYFCQIRALKLLISCPYQDQLSIVMQKMYAIGNFNGSLFATEGIASVGPWLAPASMFVCGFVIALANRLSAGLPPRFILISGAVLSQVLLNVPLTISLLTHGAVFLFLLCYITPRTIGQMQANEPLLRVDR